MSANRPKSLPAIGFLTVCEHQEHGLFGGYLVLNTSGRPLEFHCTAPVRANRAQEILYGPTLRPFLYGEQIGQALIGKAKVEPLLVCTDAEPVLALRGHAEMPVALVMDAGNDRSPTTSSDGAARQFRADPAHATLHAPNYSRLQQFQLGGHQLAVAHGQDQQEILNRWQPYADDFDLIEPFTRIREAIEEAQRSAR